MRCQEARRLISPYLDSELLGQEAFAVSRHLEQCPECARRFAAEERLERAIVAAVAPRAASAATEPPEHLRRLLTSRRRRRTLVLVPLAAVLLVAAGLSFWFRGAPVADERLGAALLRMHQDVLSGVEQPHAAATDRDAVRRFFSGKLDVAVPCPAWLDVRGVRLCALEGEPLALVFARDGGREVSVFVASPRLLEPFPEVKSRLARGEPVTGGAGGILLAVALQNECVVAAAGAVEEPLLRRILEESH